MNKVSQSHEKIVNLSVAREANELRRKREQGTCDLGCDHWPGVESDYRDRCEEHLKKRANYVKALHPSHTARFGTFEEWSLDEITYLMEELDGGHWWCDELSVATSPTLRLAKTFSRIEDIDEEDRPAQYHSDLYWLLDALLWDTDVCLQPNGKELHDKLLKMHAILGEPNGCEHSVVADSK